jgi:hypothetical protein
MNSIYSFNQIKFIDQAFKAVHPRIVSIIFYILNLFIYINIVVVILYVFSLCSNKPYFSSNVAFLTNSIPRNHVKPNIFIYDGKKFYINKFNFRSFEGLE